MYIKNILSKEYANFSIGVIFVFLFVFLYTIVDIKQIHLDKKYNNYVVGLDSVEGLEVGDDVRLSGISVGKVTNMYLREGYVPCLVLAIDKTIQLPEDSSVSINSTSFFSSNKIINLIVGVSTDYLSNGDYIAYSTPSISFNQLLDNLTRFLK